MEVREVYKLEDPMTGKGLSVHLTDSEVESVMQAGLFYLLQQGFINFKVITDAIKEQANASEETPEDTPTIQ